jgi:outer membrane protein assembly factor BamB
LNGRVYLLDYDRAAQADALRCLSLDDGREIWRYSYPVPVKRNHGMSRTVPAVTDQFVVALGPKCHVTCLDALSGQWYWSIDLVKEYGAKVPPWYAGQCPLIDGDRAILAAGGQALMLAVDCRTGSVLWKTPNPRRWQMTHSSIVPMEFAGRRMYVDCASGGVVGVSADDGTILWETDQWKIPIANIPSPVPVGEGRVFLCGGYEAGSMMLQLHQQGGRLSAAKVFRLPAGVFGAAQHTPILYQGRLYGVRPDGQLVCLDAGGKVLWTSGAALRFGLGPFLVADGRLLVMNEAGLLSMFQVEPEGLQMLAQARVLDGHDSWAPMAIAGGLLLARDLTRMVCLDLREQ